MLLYTLILIVSAVAQYLGPWWVMPIVCFIGCFWKSETPKGAFAVASLAISTLWLGYATFQNFVTEGVITNKIGEILHITNPALLLLAVTVVGGTVAGFAGLAGYYCRRVFR
jgi:hypothetical protein